jgi:hypothetical protein
VISGKSMFRSPISDGVDKACREVYPHGSSAVSIRIPGSIAIQY